MPSSPDARIIAIRKRLEAARSSLLQSSPESIEQSIPSLAEAARELGALSEEISSHPPTSGRERERLLVEARHLRADLARLAALAEQGLDFCRSWAHLIQSAMGYLPNGEAAPIPVSTTIQVQG